MTKNPFYPNYGSEPEIFLGREKIIQDVMYGLDNGPGDPNRSTVIMGPRGSGKTVVLREIKKEALQHGWITLYAVLSKRLLDNIFEKLESAAAEYLEPKQKSRITGISLGKLVITREYLANDTLSFEAKLKRILETLNEQGVGLIIEVDEVRGNSESLRELATVIQTLKGDEYDIALMLAGLPHELDKVFKDKVISFLRRSRIKELPLLEQSETVALFNRTFAVSGFGIDYGAAVFLAEKSGGFPYLVQLLGYETWELASSMKAPTTHIDIKVAKAGVKHAETYIGSSMIELILQDLSELDIAFLQSMSKTDGASKISDIANHMHVDSNKASQYRLRLLREGIITAPQRGVVDFTIPYMREYIREHY